MIQGKGPDFGREQVEINTNAFNGNAGPFPEIEIINVHTVVLHSNAFYCEYFRFFEYIFLNFCSSRIGLVFVVVAVVVFIVSEICL